MTERTWGCRRSSAAGLGISKDILTRKRESEKEWGSEEAAWGRRERSCEDWQHWRPGKGWAWVRLLVEAAKPDFAWRDASDSDFQNPQILRHERPSLQGSDKCTTSWLADTTLSGCNHHTFLNSENMAARTGQLPNLVLSLGCLVSHLLSRQAQKKTWVSHLRHGNGLRLMFKILSIK